MHGMADGWDEMTFSDLNRLCIFVKRSPRTATEIYREKMFYA
jgi:hypothetical protein